MPHAAEELPSLIEPHVAARPDAVAVIDGERRIGFAEFDRLCTRTAAWLHAQGVRFELERNDRVHGYSFQPMSERRSAPRAPDLRAVM